MVALTKVQATLSYRREDRINEGIRRLDFQLKTQNFRLSEEKRIVAEIDSLHRSKKVLGYEGGGVGGGRGRGDGEGVG